MTHAMSEDDLLYGVKEIARHIGRTPKQTGHLVAKRLIPTFRLGGTVCATRSGINEYFVALMGRSGQDGEHEATN